MKQDWIERVAYQAVDNSGKTPDVCLIEVGGTVGDIESLVFLEALRQVFRTHALARLSLICTVARRESRFR